MAMDRRGRAILLLIGTRWSRGIAHSFVALVLINTAHAQAGQTREATPAAQTDAATSRVAAPNLSRHELTRAIRLGRQFLLSQQLSNGLFRYHYNFVTREDAPGESSVRQAGALWCLACCHREIPGEDSREALLRGFDFYRKHSTRSPQGGRFLQFPGAAEGSSGAMALVALALIEFLESHSEPQPDHLQPLLRDYLTFLATLQRYDGHYHKNYTQRSGHGYGDASPYFDGEILLMLTRATRFFPNGPWQAQAERLADVCFRDYAHTALAGAKDSADTKGFFQWGCMAFSNMHEQNWPQADLYAERVIQMSHWMIDIHRTLNRRLNTAYALEGIIPACQLARKRGDEMACAKFRQVIEQTFHKLLSWQLGSIRPCAFLRQHPVTDSRDLGGVLRASDSAWLRIDVTQHQVHAMIMASHRLWLSPN
jgi:hypothetical protein